MSAPRRSARLRQKSTQWQALAGVVASSSTPSKEAKPATQTRKSRQREGKRHSNADHPAGAMQTQENPGGRKRPALEPAESARAQELMKQPVSQQPTSSSETYDEGSTFAQDSERYLELSTQLQELKAEVQETKHAFSHHKEILAKIGEVQMENVGLHILPLAEEPATLMERPQQPESPHRNAETLDHHASAQILEATTNISAKLLHAKEQLERARREFDDGRKLTAIERALLLPPYTEDNLGATMALQLSRVTRNLIDAEHRVSELRAAARLAGLVEGYPEDQTWDFEDRSDDGYADSVFDVRAEKARPDVESWLPRLAEPEDMMAPATHPRAPKSRPDVGTLELGKDNADGFPDAGHRQRIVDYRKTCEELRQTDLFPRIEPDKIIPPQ